MLSSLQITDSSPLADGASFGARGEYLRIVGVAKGEIDPRDAANLGIVDLDAAPRNERGRIAYECDVFILRPRDSAQGNGQILYEAPNRGSKHLFRRVAAARTEDNALGSLSALGNSFPLRRGFTVVWSGWDATASRARGGMAMNVPLAVRDGAPVTGVIRDEFAIGVRKRADAMLHLSYPAADIDPAHCTLTVRRGGVRHEIPEGGWEFADSRSVRLLPAGTVPETGATYEFLYPAVNAPILGLGFAATRDVVSYLRYHPAASSVTGGGIRHAIAIGLSQSGRYLRDHIAQGFNRDEEGRRVFDGVLAHTAGAGRVFLNARFAQPFRTCTFNEDHDFPENAFPFSPASVADPLTGQVGSLFRGDGCDPMLMLTNTSTEYWQKGASLLHTDPLGQYDLALPAIARAYLIAGTSHGGHAGLESVPSRTAAYPSNPHDPMPVLRALLAALEAWVAGREEPPASEIPLIANGTLVAPESLGFPRLPGVQAARETNRWGLQRDWVHPAPPSQLYRPLVCQVDEDGNEIAGIRTPDIAVPLGTYTGWNLYPPPFPEGVLADRAGSFFRFAAEAVERQENSDPRRAMAERYPITGHYASQVQDTIVGLVEQRFLLPEDGDIYLARAHAREGLPGA